MHKIQLLILLLITPALFSMKKSDKELVNPTARTQSLRIVIPTQSDNESAEESPGSTDRLRTSAGSPLRLGSPLARVKGLITPRINSRVTHSSFSGDSEEQAARRKAKEKQKMNQSSEEIPTGKKEPARKLTNQELIDIFGESFWEGELTPDSPHTRTEQRREDSDSLEAMICAAREISKTTDN